jgi:CyaY protein
MDDFHKVSTLALEEVSDFFEFSWPEADVDLLDETLTVTLPKSRQYVINKHGVTQQIWVASPFSGAHHFHMKEGEWRCTRTGTKLQDFLLNEKTAYAA